MSTPQALERLLAAPEVHQLGVAAEVEHHILRLQVAVHDAAAVEVLQRQGDAAAVEPADAATSCRAYGLSYSIRIA